MQLPQPTEHHQWLDQLVGEWRTESEWSMGDDQPAMKTTGKQITRSLGGFWTLGEMETIETEGEPMKSLITLGFDPLRGKFVGTFIASCMSFHWLYEGTLDDQRRILTLETSGPSFANDGSMSKYQDVIEWVDENTYLFWSRYQLGDGSWKRFMNGKHTRMS